jgi:hypothetical protein
MAAENHLVRFVVDDDHAVVIEVDEPDDQLMPVGPGDTVRQATDSFGKHLRDVQVAVRQALDTLRESIAPDELKITLGVKFSSEAGAIIAKCATEANLTVEMTFQSQTKRP